MKPQKHRQGMNNLIVNDLFYSLQGEGYHAGEAAVFIRLAGCNLHCPYCDTDYISGIEMSMQQIDSMLPAKCKWIVWTGGEPAQQLTEEHIQYFQSTKYYQAIETNGSLPVPAGLDYVSCSPKIDLLKVKRNLSKYQSIGETRCLIGIDDDGISHFPPDINLLPKSIHYYVSPMFIGEEHKKYELDKSNLQKAIEWVKFDPRWKLSIQQHKIWNIP